MMTIYLEIGTGGRQDQSVGSESSTPGTTEGDISKCLRDHRISQKVGNTCQTTGHLHHFNTHISMIQVQITHFLGGLVDDYDVDDNSRVDDVDDYNIRVDDVDDDDNSRVDDVDDDNSRVDDLDDDNETR